MAEELACAVGARGDDREDLFDAARRADRYLGSIGEAGRWERLDVSAVFEALDASDWMKRARFLFALAALVGWCALRGYLDDDAADTLLDDVARLADDPIIRRYALVGARRPELGRPFAHA